MGGVLMRESREAVGPQAEEDVAAYAIGPNAAAVRGVMDQNELFDVMAAVLFGGTNP
ncbi:MAG: hypothetical protein AAF648_03820 [Pseudomonadota bacterium]